MNKTTEKQEDRLLHEALQRRADRVPALSDDFQERVMARLRPLSISPQREESRGSRHRRWMPLAWVGNIAAAVVVGWFVFFRTAPSPIPSRGKGVYTDTPSLAQEARETQLPAHPLKGTGSQELSSPAIRPSRSGTQGRSSAKDRMLTQHVSVSSPSPQGRAGGGSVCEQTVDADMSAFYASMEEIERSALREANTLTGETLGQACGATSPS